jgi:hypothetical protein
MAIRLVYEVRPGCGPLHQANNTILHLLGKLKRNAQDGNYEK